MDLRRWPSPSRFQPTPATPAPASGALPPRPGRFRRSARSLSLALLVTALGGWGCSGGGGGGGGGGGAPNTPPQAAFSGGQGTGPAPFVVTLDASASSDAEDAVADLQVRWDVDNDGTWDTPFSVQKVFAHTYTSQGTYRVRLEVRDTGGFTDSVLGSGTITVLAPNTAPVAAFTGGSGGGTVPHTINLDASSSSDAEDSVSALEVRWDFEDDGTWDTSFDVQKTVSHTYQSAGNYRVRLEVRDTGGLTGTTLSPNSITVSPPNTAPNANYTASIAAGHFPLAVTFDASTSNDAQDSLAALEVRWDFEDDGTWDTTFSTTKTANHTYTGAGTFDVRVEVRDTGGLTATSIAGGPVVVSATPPSADLDADTNRDGLVNASDDANEDMWNASGGAVVLANVDDDDQDGARDGQNAVVDGTTDLLDMAQVVLPQNTLLTGQHTVTLLVEPPAGRDRVRIFRNVTGGGTALLTGPGQGTANIPVADLQAGDVTLWVEATETRTPAWDGNLSLTLRILNGGATVDEDQVALRCAPVLFPDNTLPAQTFYLMRISGGAPNLPFYNASVANTPAGIQVFTVSEFTYFGDRWVQDNMQVGYQAMPTSGADHVMVTFLQTVRGRGLGPLVLTELLGPDSGYWAPPGVDSSFNYGGNIEVTPPFSVGPQSYPFGRMVIGGGDTGSLLGSVYSEHMTMEQRDWMDAQVLQGPAEEISTEWLAVGHVDEYSMFIPDPSSANGTPWKLLLASPTLAWNQLVALNTGGQGNLVVFNGRASQTTVATIVNDASLFAFNQAAQARIDSIRAQLQALMGFAAADVIELPVLFEPHYFGGTIDYAAAYNPGINNLVTLDSTLLIPDPEGPNDGGGDIWQVATLQQLNPLGLNNVFVDVFTSYHELLGEAHCGSNVLYDPHSAIWWQQ